MSKSILTLSLLLLCVNLFAQNLSSNTSKKGNPSVSEMQKKMEESMKDMDPDEKAELQKMMKGMMPAMTEPSEAMFVYADFETNAQLVPKKDRARIAAIPKQKVTAATIGTYASNLYAKIMAKGEPQEIALIKSVLTKAITASDLNNAAILAMAQGHPQTAMALSMKAVQKDQTNTNFQNNMAALLSQYGYSEQAIPILDKLIIDFPYNSTVLNNLGQAWFSLGELDSAKVYISNARMINPYNPESTLCGGIMAELDGDPIKATNDYVEVFEQQPGLIVETVLKNKTNNNFLDKIDFEKLKKNMVIYQYFNYDWIMIPEYTNHVSNFETDISIQNGYAKMFEELKNEAQQMGEGATIQMEQLNEHGENEFINTMMHDYQKGHNKMSRTSSIIIMFLENYMINWKKKLHDEESELQRMIEEKTSVKMTKSGKDDKCIDWDRKNNEFMQYINPKIRIFYDKKLNEFTDWLNAYCTYSWYITGNAKNINVLNINSWMNQLIELYERVALDQIISPKSCVNQNSDGVYPAILPQFPNISCPTIIQVPVGSQWQQLSNSFKNFDGNKYGIQANPANAIPNHSILISPGNSSIAQSGTSPSITSNGGNYTVSNFQVNNSLDKGLMKAFRKINKNKGIGEDDELAWIPNIKRNNMLKQMLNKMITADCKNLKKRDPRGFIVKMGKLTLVDVPEENVPENYAQPFNLILYDENGVPENDTSELKTKETTVKGNINVIQYDDGSSYTYLKDGSVLELHDVDAKNIKSGKSTLVKTAPLPPKSVTNNDIYKELNDIKTSLENVNLPPTLNTGVQVPGTIQPQKGLFNN